MKNTLTADDVRQLLQTACDQAGSRRAWCEAHGVHDSMLTGLMQGADPPPKVLKALGLTRRYVYELDI